MVQLITHPSAYHLLNNLLASAGILFYLIKRKADDGPSINHQLVLTFQAVGKLPSADVL
ncbi:MULTISPECIES: hypothetical protein [Bacillaceae]|uniref:hypothetical protein n=1 Tax=Bacillaceae TaxID=186817 RepID=UPI001CD809FE|nr:hypothetical protein [Bacillus infantis]MCA1035297.1 hypothetical protein [Bacillus infantis]MDW2877953.1 hypothetical protein [Bacillus infantis]